MYFLYDLTVHLTAFLLRIPALFQPKIQRFLKGRKVVWEYLRGFRDTSKPLIWMHTASLGEFEQGLPVLELIKKEYPAHQILVTFFSPSGYDVKKNSLGDTGVCYLPLDTRANARAFIRIARPSLALFVKYEIWPNFYKELSLNGIPIVMVSAVFNSGQAYFKWYGGFLRKALHKVTHFYLQDEQSAGLLDTIGIGNYTICGDTRFDRVLQILDRDNTLDFMEAFTNGRTCLVAGSTWPQDEKVLWPFLKEFDRSKVCAVVAPHAIDTETILRLAQKLGDQACLFSDISGYLPKDAAIIIVDTIGLLTKIYSYADLAYVGGGFATGLHNTLEPAVFGIPVLIGPEFKGFREAEALVARGGIQVVRGPESFRELAGELIVNPEKRRQIGAINASYIGKSRGASIQILQGLRKLV